MTLTKTPTQTKVNTGWHVAPPVDIKLLHVAVLVHPFPLLPGFGLRGRGRDLIGEISHCRFYQTRKHKL